MTLNTTYNPTVADGNGTTKEFSYNFNPLAREYLKVSFQINNEWVEQKSGWSATVSENGGVVTFDIAPTTRVAIERDVPEEQPTQYKTSSGFQAEVIEHSFDLLTGMVQELKDETSRSVKVEVGSNISPDKIVAQVERVYDSIDNIDTVGMDKDNIDAVATNISKVNTIANNINDVKTVADNIEIIDNVAWNKSNINNVSVNMPFVEGVSENVEHVVAVDRNKANIDNVATNKTNINNVAENITAVNNVSENMADVKNAVQSANDAKLWAVGTITEKPEGSSKYWAEQAQQAAQVYDATETVKGIVRLATSEEVTAGTNNSAVITPLKLKSKLDTKQDKLTAVNYNNISNCITYIPQDIKLELNNGTLTLKAGSKVYVPNGFESDGTTKKFDVVNIQSDITVYSPYTNEPIFIYYYNNGTAQAANNSQCSGTSNTIIDGYWYDTTNNFIKRISAGEVVYPGVSLPIAIVNASNSSWTSIDQVFNGFGYIGSTVYALPGVKGLIPNGRNADGSLKNIEFTLDKVLASTRDWNVSNQYNQHIRLGLNTIFTSNGYVESVNMPTVNNHIMWYNPRDNIMRYNDTNNSVTSIADYPIVEMIELGGTGAGDGTSRITSFTPKTVFHALDYNDKSTISGWGMPSSRYIDLTLGASGSTYTAPANGWLILNKAATEIGQEIRLINQSNQLCGYAISATNNASLDTKIPCRKADTILVYYSAYGSVANFRFIYAEGE